MKKQTINGGLHRWKTLFLVIALLFGTISVPVKVYANPYGGGDGNCTYTAWRLAYEKTGVSLPGWGNAGTWYNSARNAGYTVSTVPRAQSIAVWSGGPSGYGHVAYVSQVSGDQIYIQEGGYSGGYHEGWENAYGQTKYYSSNRLTMIGYIYLGDTAPVIQSGYLNEGQSFDAYIIRTDVWKHITYNSANGGNVELSSENKAIAKQAWHFERQGDGSYIITSLYNGMALDVANAGTSNGTNVGLCAKWGTDNGAQKWFIYGNQNARRFVPKNAPDKCLDCATGSAATGTNLQIYQWNETAAQVFSIYGIGAKPPESVQINQNSYSIIIGEPPFIILADVKPYDSGYKDLIYSVEDPSIAVMEGNKIKGVAAGSTTVTIYSAYNDRLKCTVTINVSEAAPCVHPNIQTQNAREKTCTADGYTGDVICVDCHEVIEQGTVIPAEGHAWGDFITVREADCVHEGERQRACENCGETETEKIAALGHVVVEDEAVPATTSSAGLTKGSHCGVCGEILEEQKTVPKLTSPQPPRTACSHSNTQTQGAREATCTADGYTGDLICVDCHEVIEQGRALPAGGHAWGEWRIVREADCTHDGERRRSCADCGETETGKIAALGHVVAEGESRCSVCGEAVKNQNEVPVQTTKNPQSSQKPQNSGQAGGAQKISKGKIYQSGKFYYRVLSETEKTVAVAGPVKKAEKNIIIPSAVSIDGVTCSVREIGANAFQNNKKLQKVTVGKNVAKIGKCAFKGCKNLKTVKIQNKQLSNVGKNAFQNVNRRCKIKVPSANVKQYKKLFKGKGQAKSVKITK